MATGKRSMAFFITALVLAQVLGLALTPTEVEAESTKLQFSGQNAYASVQTQMAYGTRIPGTKGHLDCMNYIVTTLRTYGLEVSYQNFTADSGEGEDMDFRNIVGLLSANSTTETDIILSAHFDTRPFTDRDITKGPVSPDYTKPIPGANDGGSGVAVLIELARVMRQYNRTKNIKFIFFDGEDYGQDIQSMLYGSKYYASKMTKTEIDNTDYLLLFDMVGDKQLTIYREANSDSLLMNRLWSKAEALGNAQFVNTTRYNIIDDHIPFRDRGIRVVDMIDFDYPNETLNYWHTTEDTLDKVSSVSLEAVGRTAEAFLVDDLVPEGTPNGTNGNNTTNGPKPPKPPDNGKKGFIPGLTAPLLMSTLVLAVGLRALSRRD